MDDKQRLPGLDRRLFLKGSSRRGTFRLSVPAASKSLATSPCMHIPQVIVCIGEVGGGGTVGHTSELGEWAGAEDSWVDTDFVGDCLVYSIAVSLPRS